MDKHSLVNTRTFPFAWPWADVNNNRIPLMSAIVKRKFSYLYLLTVWGIIVTLGYGENSKCSETWKTVLQCEYSFWVRNLTENPLIFLRNVFTTSLVHNNWDHILFVTIAGVFIVIQSYEVRFGAKETAFMFLFGYFLVAGLFGIFYTWGLAMWPDSEFFLISFSRNWTGGSLGLMFLFGGLVYVSKRPLLLISLPFIFESWNYFINGIKPHITMMHLVSVLFGLAAKATLEHYRSRSKQLEK
ncbi:MAG: hypothetical protein ABJG78_13955 [Cyclobacteriaceae bacterium]